MSSGFVHLADDEAKDILLQSFCGLPLERFQFAHRRCLLDPAAPRHGCEIRFPRSRTRLANPRPAVDLIVKDEDRKVGRIRLPRVGRL